MMHTTIDWPLQQQQKKQNCTCYIIYPGVAECYLEDLQSPSHLSSVWSALPSVCQLSSRLKPKLISDPLLSPTTGQFLSYHRLCQWVTESLLHLWCGQCVCVCVFHHPTSYIPCLPHQVRVHLWGWRWTELCGEGSNTTLSHSTSCQPIHNGGHLWGGSGSCVGATPPHSQLTSAACISQPLPPPLPPSSGQRGRHVCGHWPEPPGNAVRWRCNRYQHVL